MSVFGAYARYYNLLYQDKDYTGEAQFVLELLRRYAPDLQSVLELGCGTGKHAVAFAEAGCQVHGVDLSAEMVSNAEKLFDTLPDTLPHKPTCVCADIREFRMPRTFDAVVSLFHVISYQTRNADLADAFATARSHLKPGGVFLFDCWYGPAVLTDPPHLRVKELGDSQIKVLRIAEPTMHTESNTVDVNYKIIVLDKQTQKFEEFSETHTMRYLFQPELEFFLSAAGFELLANMCWMSDKSVDIESWNAAFIGRAI